MNSLTTIQGVVIELLQFNHKFKRFAFNQQYLQSFSHYFTSSCTTVLDYTKYTQHTILLNRCSSLHRTNYIIWFELISGVNIHINLLTNHLLHSAVPRHVQ